MIRILALALIVLGLIAMGLRTTAIQQQARIASLEGQLRAATANTAAALVVAQQRPQVEIRYRDGLREVEAHGGTSEVCRNDPAVLAAYDYLRGLRDDDADRTP